MNQTFGAYIGRRWQRVAAAAGLIGLAFTAVFLFSLLLTANPATQAQLEVRSTRWVKVAGRIAVSELEAAVPGVDIRVIPATVSYLRYPLLWGRSALLPVYGMSEEDARHLLKLADSTLRAERTLPGPGGVYVPPMFLRSLNLHVGSEVESPDSLQRSYQYRVEGIIEGEVPYALTSTETVASMPAQEQVLLVYSPALNTAELEAALEQAFASSSDVRITGPGYYGQLHRERMREHTLLLTVTLALVFMGLFLGHWIIWGRDRSLLAVEQVLAKLYYHALWQSLFRPVAVSLSAGLAGYGGGLLLSLVTALGIGHFWLLPRGISYQIPWPAVLVSLILILAPVMANLLHWAQARKLDQIEFLRQAQEFKKAEVDHEVVRSSPHVSSGLQG